MNLGLIAMGFVVGVRILWLAIAVALVEAVRWVRSLIPSSEPPWWVLRLRSDIKRLKHTVIPDRIRAFSLRDYIGHRSPEWIERHETGALLVKTTVGMDRLDAIVDRLPDGPFRVWRRVGVIAFSMLVVIWGGLLLASLPYGAWLTGHAIADAVTWAVAFDWIGALSQPPKPAPAPDVSLADTAVALAALVIGILLAIIFWWVLMLPFMPGLILHEFGHYAALRKAGASVDSFGILLFGPFLGGAFVQPGSDSAVLDHDTTLGVWAGGVANTIVAGTILLTAGVLLGGDPVRVVEMAISGEWVLANPIATGVTLIGLFELGNGFLNALPLGPVDGGGFIRQIEREWWGFDKAIREVRI